jgi:hypothetical protein
VDLTCATTTLSSAAKELENFVSEPVHLADVLQWWKQKESRFPSLAILAKWYLCIPATEVPSERAFSAAGMTVNKLRASLDSESVDKILFIHKNFVMKEKLCLQSPTDNSQAERSQAKQTPVPAMKAEPGSVVAMPVGHTLPSLDNIPEPED